jgi:hypothetical protein
MSIEQQRAQASNPVVCEGALYYSSQAAKDEAQRRGIDCNDFRQEAAALFQSRINADQARRAAATNFLIQRALTPPAPIQPMQPIQPPQSFNCTSNRLGNSVQTHCW